MSSRAPARGALALAEEAYAHVQVRPDEASALAERALVHARREGDVEAEVAAYHALSWAQHVVGDPRAVRTARTGIRIGESRGERRRVALLRRRLALALAGAGSTRAAQREIQAAVAQLRGRDRAESQVFRVAVHRRAQAVSPQAHREILTAAARALRTFERDGDRIWQARILYNRGLLLFDRGELDAAEEDLRRAHRLYRQVGAEEAALDAAAPIAEIMLMRGDVVGCLEAVDELKANVSPERLSLALDGCRAAALAQARLLPEARSAIDAHLAAFSRAGRGDFVSTTLLDQGAIAILSNDPATARRAARQAARSFAARGKSVNAAQARALGLEAQLLEGTVRRGALRSGLDAASVLEQAGWRLHALRTRLLVSRAALAAGSRTITRQQLELALPLGRRGTVSDRIELLHTRALLRVADGDPGGGERLLRRGLRLLDDYRAALGSIELRATASTIGSNVAQSGLRIALGSGRPAKVLAWAEQLRGNALRLPPVRPPADLELRRSQAELRGVEARIRAAEASGKPDRGLETRRIELETAIRARSRRVRGDGAATVAPPSVGDASRALGERVLLEYVELDGALHALTLANGRLTLHDIQSGDAGLELEWLRFALGRLAGRAGSAAQRTAALANATAAAQELDRLLLGPLLPVVGDAPLVIVPTGALHALPWGALPSMRGRPFVVAPSLSTWLDAATRPPSRRRRTALIAGPRLRHATAEIRQVAVQLPGARVLTGDGASAKATLAALDGAALAHLACHGRFRSDSPLFSALELADGPLTAFDLQRLRRPPDVLVLSSCDLALSDRHPGDELLGLSAALLAMGTRTIVASVVPVPDAAARRLMLVFHRELASGGSPSVALARAQATLRRGSAALAGFVCLGTG